MNRPPPPQLWTARQRRMLLAAVVPLLLALSVALLVEPADLPDPARAGDRAAELSTRLDPNTADAAALSALPGLGEARARAIIDYRTAHARPGRPAFTTARDLLPIHGIGVSTVANLEPSLTFRKQ